MLIKGTLLSTKNTCLKGVAGTIWSNRMQAAMFFNRCYNLNLFYNKNGAWQLYGMLAIPLISIHIFIFSRHYPGVKIYDQNETEKDGSSLWAMTSVLNLRSGVIPYTCILLHICIDIKRLNDFKISSFVQVKNYLWKRKWNNLLFQFVHNKFLPSLVATLRYSDYIFPSVLVEVLRKFQDTLSTTDMMALII